ncbi:MAG TPA: hypothetical protein VK207_04715 [Bacteroidales bacterium]|nr:hypothetical protein [Bacteroidales bacterium]
MEFKKLVRPYFPHFLAVVLFTVLAFAYFYPVLEGKQLRANDTQVHRINSKEIQDYREKYGKEPLWTNSIFSGMPAYLISTRYPGNLIKYVDTVLRQYKMPVSVLFVSLLGFYILLVLFGLNPWLAMTGAIAYGFTSFFFQILGAGHNTQAIAMAYMPPLIGSIWYAYRHNIIKGALLTGFFLALELQANHPQITYYAFLCVLVLGITEFVYSFKNRTMPDFLKRTAILILPAMIAVGINFASLYTTYEYGKYSTRGKSELTGAGQKASSGLDKDYILAWSYGIGETLNMLIPNYKGGSSHGFKKDSEVMKVMRQNKVPAETASSLPMYWGEQQWTEGPHYVGAIVFFLFIFGLTIIKGPVKWWLLSATILSVMLAWGKNFMPLSSLFIDIFPGYNKFRSVTFILAIAEFCIPLLGFIALRDVFNGTVTRNEIFKGLKISLGITGGFLLLVLLIPGIAGSFLAPQERGGYPAWLIEPIVSERKGLLRTDAFRSLVFILLFCGLLYAFITEKLKAGYFIFATGLLILIDLWSVDRRYMNEDRFEKTTAMNKVFTPTPADAFIMKDTSIIRVLNLTASPFNDNTPTSYFHHSIGGYHGAKMERYQEFIDSAISPNIDLLAAAGRTATSLDDFTAVFKNTYALNILNTKYVIGNSDAQPLVNNNALGNAWFVEKPVIVANANEEIASLDNFNPSTEALVDKSFSNFISKESYPSSAGDTIRLTSYLPNELVYKYSAGAERLAVFSEIYYPAGWKCFIDGKESEHFRADYVLRAMVVPAGDHEIRFSFEPASYITGNKISLASSLILLLGIAGYIVMGFRNKRENRSV